MTNGEKRQQLITLTLIALQFGADLEHRLGEQHRISRIARAMLDAIVGMVGKRLDSLRELDRDAPYKPGVSRWVMWGVVGLCVAAGLLEWALLSGVLS